ncbi:MAG: thioredoxin domain-containing protein [Melioribacteraceae bacterium]|nr:thioredoxin domain-containing protein [Melioribacteraceae bacterium]
MKNKKANRLINTSNPYLLQHAYNPVDWYPWGEEAFQKAITENKPIFLSIGYSTCHWCHVMQHESFEDEVTARFLNDNFISIKLDREERPDLDHVYMNAAQIMGVRGGWPLTVFIDHNKRPFFIGTYFPKDRKFGRITFIELLEKIIEAWNHNRTDIKKTSSEIVSYLNKTDAEQPVATYNANLNDKIFESLQSNYDEKFGGFGTAPKFPSLQNILFLLRYSPVNSNALTMTENTLIKFRCGGIYDQVGFGFHRYSTDQKLLVPHFEKMLYDQAMAIYTYSEAYNYTKNDLFKNTVGEIFEYVSRELTSPDGAFYCAEDADSEGAEGLFYLWEKGEIESLLSPEQSKLICEHYNINSAGNYNDEITHSLTGKNIPFLSNSIELISAEYKSSVEDARQILFEHRDKRVHPFKDDKILADWNGLMIAAMAKAGRTFDNFKYISAAEKAYQFVSKNLTEADQLFHSWKDEKTRVSGNLDDYAFFILGTIELFQATQKLEYLIDAKKKMDRVFSDFGDEEAGFYFSSSTITDLISRTKLFYDGAYPSGNSVLYHCLSILAHIFPESRYLITVEKISRHYANLINTYPAGYSYFAASNLVYSGERLSLLVIVYKDKNELDQLIKKLSAKNNPSLFLIMLHNSDLPEIFANYKMINNKITFYHCYKYVCEPATNILPNDFTH